MTCVSEGEGDSTRKEAMQPTIWMGCIFQLPPPAPVVYDTARSPNHTVHTPVCTPAPCISDRVHLVHRN